MSTIYLQFSSFFLNGMRGAYDEDHHHSIQCNFQVINSSSERSSQIEIFMCTPEVAFIEKENEGRKIASLREAKKLKIGHHHSLHGSSAVNRVNQHQRREKFNFPLLFTRRRVVDSAVVRCRMAWRISIDAVKST